MKRVVTFGTFDVFHIGHVNLLSRAAELGDHLTVGVSSDELARAKKGRYPVYRQERRMGIVRALACVDDVFVEDSLGRKREYLSSHSADVIVMGDDWAGRLDDLRDQCDVVYLPRTPDVSTAGIIRSIREDLD